MGIDPRLIPAVMQQESGGNPAALSSKGAAGVMQIMPETARNPGFGVVPLQGWDGVDPRTASPEEQIRFGTEYLNALANHFGGDTRMALAAYNAGPTTVQNYGGVPPFKETQNYVDNVVEGSQTPTQSSGTPAAPESDWKSRSELVQSTASTSDWKSRSELVQPTTSTSDWKSRSKLIKAEPRKVASAVDSVGAALQGFNSAIPFGERISAGVGAAGTTLADKLLGIEDQGLSANYKTARVRQKNLAEKNKGAYAIGTGLGLANALLLGAGGGGSGGGGALKGAANGISEALSSVGNWARGSKVAGDAGLVAKAANLAGKAGRSAAVAAPAGAAYSYGASENDLNSPEALQDALVGGGVAAGLGAALPVAGAAAGAVGGAVVPKVSKEVAALADVAKTKFGINLSLDQIAPTNVRSTVQKISQNIPGSGVEAFQEAGRQQWIKGVAKTIGEEADNLGPDTIKNYLSRASSDFDSTLGGKTFSVTPEDLSGIQDIAKNATRKVTDDVAKVVRNNVNDFVKNLGKFTVGKNRTVAGEKLASLRSQIVKDLPSIDSQAREHVGDIVDKIDDIIARNLSPEEARKLSTARLQWRNFRTLEPLLEKSPDGMINPTQLMQRVASSKFIKASRKTVGEDDLVDLARIGKQFLVEKGGSDTAQKLAYLKGAAQVSTVGGALLAPFQVIPAVGANAAYQRLINQSPKLVSKSISKSAPVADRLGAVSVPRLSK